MSNIDLEPSAANCYNGYIYDPTCDECATKGRAATKSCYQRRVHVADRLKRCQTCEHMKIDSFFIKEDKSIAFYTIVDNSKEPGYIPIGASITSYARNFTIRAAQKNYYGVNERGFIYADTDSIHCDLEPDEIVGITEHPKNFCCWKLESCWDEAIFTRQKTYIEHITHKDRQPIDKPYYDVKCAGMSEKCKQLFVDSITGKYDTTEMTEEEKEFVQEKRELTDFKIGLKVPGKLMPKRIQGGTLLVETTYEMR